jgi:lambda family phage portal protein
VKRGNWIDRVIAAVSPVAGVERLKARGVLEKARADYDGATQGRRAASWRRRSTDANAELSPAAQRALRAIAHDLVRNNPWAASAVRGIADHLVGPGITFQVMRGGVKDDRLHALALAHFDTTACDAEGRHNFYGLQYLAARSMVTSGGMLARRRWRRMTDRLPVPMQLQLLEPDYVDMSMTGAIGAGGAYRIAGIEFDPLGRRTGYQMYAGHPGSLLPTSLTTRFVPAADVAHLFRVDRPEQQHGAPWFAPVVLRMKDFGEYVDAQVVRQKIAAAYTAFRFGDPESDPAPQTDSNGNPVDLAAEQEYLEPGMIIDVAGDGDIKFSSPPAVDGYAEFTDVTGHEIAAGLGLPYEVMSGDLSGVSFISGRLGRLHFKRAVESWQWNTFIPQFCEPAARWFLEAAAMMGEDVEGVSFVWAPPEFEMMDPASEVPATVAEIRGGLITLSGALRRRGLNPNAEIAERAADNAMLDAEGIVLESDPRRVTQVGNSVMMPNADTRNGVPPQ